MLTLGISFSIEKTLSLWRRSRVLLQTLLAVIGIFPLAVFLLLKGIVLPPEVSTGLVLLAACPGAPLTTKRAYMAGAKISYVSGLQFTLAMLAVIVTPLTLNIFNSSFDLLIEKVTPWEIARQITEVQLLPIGIGLLLQKIAPKVTIQIEKPLNILANILFVILVIVAIIPAFLLISQMSLLSIAMIIIVVSFGLSIGHFLGGFEIEKRSALAIASVARNFGLALFIAILHDIQKLVLPTLVAYLILGAILAIPYSL
jgi:BASS family bile acid:Na+ symporter